MHTYEYTHTHTHDSMWKTIFFKKHWETYQYAEGLCKFPVLNSHISERNSDLFSSLLSIKYQKNIDDL